MSSSSSSWYSAPDADAYTISDQKPLHLLNPNQFYKICPETQGGQAVGDDPVCGDGSPFCFYFSKPSQRSSNRDKLLVELMGGGACWDADTCDRQADMLYVNENLDDALGRSCQEVQYGFRNEGAEINMLCSNQLGSSSNNNNSEEGSSVDFTRYNTIIVPYCTQDVHLGSNTKIYYENDNDDDGGNNNNGGDDDNRGNYRAVHHKGANNLRAVTQWIYRNFPHLRHAAVTGCSAGGTAVPVLQQLLHKHYNHFGNRATQVSAMADSPVYLTPTYFLENALDHWNPQPILSSIGIPYDKYRSTEEYPTMMWDYILKKGNNKNRWGFVSHTEDPVSLTYFQYMSGYGDGNNNNNNNNYNYNYGDDDGNYNNDDGNNNNDDGESLEDQWHSELSSSVQYIQKRHKNVKSYWMESEGHCSFGLYYALQEDDFSSFAASVFREDALVTSAKPALKSFFVAATMGTVLLAALVIHRIRRQSSLNLSVLSEDDEILKEMAQEKEAAAAAAAANNNNTDTGTVTSGDATQKDGVWAPSVSSVDLETLATRRRRSLRRRFRALMMSMDDCPVTSGYTLWITVYFCAMMYSEGFAHPINNPSLGPSALGLSVFGINNPSLIVYKHQWFRLFTSNFLVSGVLTLGMAYFYLWHRIRKLEERMILDFKSPWLFVTILVILATVINAAYCLVPPRRGASTAGIPLLIGLQCFHLTFYWNSFVRPYLSIGAVVFDTFVVVFLFPFNSWVMIGAAWVTGWITAKMARSMDKWLPGPMMYALQQTGIQLELGSASGDARSAAAGGPAAFGTALSFPPNHESEYNNFDGNLSNSYETMDDQRSLCDDHKRGRREKWLKRALCSGVSVVVVVLGVPLFVTYAATPDEAYLEAFRTGCKSFYTVDIDDLSASSFLSNDDDNYQDRRSLVAQASAATTQVFFRWLAGENEPDAYGCAEFCVPHLLVPFVKGVLKKKQVPIYRGQCSEQGYGTHVLDKTFTAFSYSLDVELYAASNDRDDDENDNDEK